MRQTSTISPSSSSDFQFDSTFDPFDLQFAPEKYARKKSHFQASFFFVLSQKRRRALEDLYAFCRLSDDIADEAGPDTSFRRNLLQHLREWVTNAKATGHPYWDRFLEERKRFQIPDSVLLGILAGVEMDLNKSRFETWKELDEYVYGVACCVGEAVLCVLGANGPEASVYAYHLGRSMQYLNIMRDLREDFANEGRIYVPEEFLKSLGISGPQKEFPPAEAAESIRQELFSRAKEFRRLAVSYSWRCFPAELMSAIYWSAARKYWRFGNPQRLTKWEKISACLKFFFRFWFQSRKGEV